MNKNLHKKVLIIGSPGSGKSYLSNYLGELMDLKVIHLDDHYWSKNWIEPSNEDWEKKIIELSSAEEWIIEGNYTSTLKHRLKKCDLIIYLDLNTFVCLLSVIKRLCSIKLGNKNLLPLKLRDGSKDSTGILEFLAYVLFFKKNNRKKIYKMIDQLCSEKKVIIIRRREIVNTFIKKILH